MRDMLRSLSPVTSQSITTRVFVLSSMLSSEMYLRLKSYLVVKMSSDLVTKHCCQLYVLSMMFAAPTAGCVDIAQSIHLSTTDLECKKYFFTFYFHILQKQIHIGARIISCHISIKKIPHVDYWQWKLSLKLLDCGRKIQNDIHNDT